MELAEQKMLTLRILKEEIMQQIQNNVTNTTPIKQTSVSNTNSTEFQAALKHFDDLYQKSQISGVSTYLFTKALGGYWTTQRR